MRIHIACRLTDALLKVILQQNSQQESLFRLSDKAKIQTQRQRLVVNGNNTHPAFTQSKRIGKQHFETLLS